MRSEDPPPAPDAAYARKLGLALLSVLQDKGVLTETDVNTILIAVNRSIQHEAVQHQAEPQDATGGAAPRPANHEKTERQPQLVPQIDMEL